MPAAIIGGVIAGAGALGAAAISSSGASSAAQTEANAAAQSNALQSQIYDSNKALAQPYIGAGNAALSELEGFLGLGGDPAASQKALDSYLQSTGYQFTLDQGLDAVTQSKAASGLLGSGSTLKALDAYGSGLADQYGQQYEQNLQGLSNTGQAAAASLANNGQSYANAVGANNANAANASASAAVTNASTTANAFASALKSFGTVLGGSSYGGGGSSAATSVPAYTPLNPNAFSIGG
jgi:hypothetical protein